MNLSVLALLLRPAPGQRSVLALPIVAFGVVTTLVLTVIGGAQAFWTWTDDEAVLYQALAAIALVLLVVPLTSLGGAAARLSARRRDERLSTLRLLGVTPGGVTTATVVESVLVAAAGAVIGIGGHLALSPLIGLIPFRGDPLGLSAVVLPPAMIAAVVGGVLLLAAGSAVVGLRRVVISPLGVRTRTAPTNVHWIRAVIAVVGIATAFVLIKVFPMIGGGVGTIAPLAARLALRKRPGVRSAASRWRASWPSSRAPASRSSTRSGRATIPPASRSRRTSGPASSSPSSGRSSWWRPPSA